MKLIAKTEDGYLAEVSELEVYRLSAEKLHHQVAYGSKPNHTGANLKIIPAIDHVKALREHGKRALEAAATLRTFAGILERSIPEIIEEPKPPKIGGDE